jgi:hypothetical protein
MDSQEMAGLHKAVFRNTAKDPLWVGFWLVRHQEHENLNEEQLAQKLGTTMDNFVLLHLCRTPRDDQFLEDVEVICRRTGARQEEFLDLLRQEQNLYQLKKSGPPTERGWLMAASDGPDCEKSSRDPGGEDEPKAD